MVVLKDLVTVTGLRFESVDVERRRRRDVVLSIREELVWDGWLLGSSEMGIIWHIAFTSRYTSRQRALGVEGLDCVVCMTSPSRYLTMYGEIAFSVR